MAQKRDKRFTIRAMPWRPSLATAGQQSSIDELTGCWKARNAISDLDGMLSKRPGVTQWGQTLKRPDSDSEGITAFVDFLNGIAEFTETDSSSSLITTSTNEGVLRTNVAAGSSNEYYSLAYPIGALSSNDTWSIRFLFRGINLPAQGTDDTNRDTFVFRVIGATGSGKEFAIWSGGIYWKKTSDNKYTLISSTSDAGSGKWVVIEVQCDDTADEVNLYLDDTLITTTALTASDMASVAPTGTSLFEFRWEVEGTGATGTQYSTRISTPMYHDTVTDPFEVITVSTVTDFQYMTGSNTPKKALLCAAGDHIYHDNALEEVWRPLNPKKYSDVYFTSYRESLVWTDCDGNKNSDLWEWDGRNTPETYEDAPLLSVITEHQQRLWGIGPGTNRVYYSADRQLDTWYSPTEDNIEDEFDTALDAGYVEIPLKHGDRNTALFGDYYGTILVFTRRGVWQISGSGIFSWSRRNISQKYGCESHYGVTQVESTVWFISNLGIVALVPVDQYGDIQPQVVSTSIGDLWGENPASEKMIAKDYLSKSILDINTSLGLVYVSAPLSADIYPNNTYVFSLGAKSWLGPWEIDQRCMASVEIGSPTREVMLHGTADGQVGFTNLLDKQDYGSTAVTIEVESPILNGRSLEQAIPGITYMKKSWRTLRLWLLPRGDWDVDISWYADDDATSGSDTASQNVFNAYVLGDESGDGTGDFRLDITPDGVLSTMESLGYIETDLEKSGYGLYFNVQQSGAGEDLVLQGYEVDFVIEGYEEQ